jgi:energy-coupling factor transporter transmembrane protein EcfT
VENRAPTFLGRLNPTTAFLTTAVLVVLALFVGSWFGAIVLGALGALLAFILVRIWAVLDTPARALRVTALLAVAALAAAQLLR